MSPTPAPKTRTGKLLLLAATALLVGGSCAALVLDPGPRDCPRPEPKMAGLSAKTFEGRYEGPDGMTVDLGRDGTRPRMETGKWPFDLFALDDGEVGESGTGEVRRFSGSGSWEYGASPDPDGKRSARKYPYISLDFQTGRPADDVPPSPQYLMVGGTPEHPALLAQEDARGCPDAVFRR